MGKRIKVFSSRLLLLLCLLMPIFISALSQSAETTGRLGIFVSSQATKGSFGTVYYKEPQVECWLDDKLIYKGPVKKGGEKTQIFYGSVPSGRHLLKLRWKVRVRGDESARVKSGGRRIVDWVKIPEQGFAEHYFKIQGTQTKAIQVSVFRSFGLLKNRSEIQFREEIWHKGAE